MIGYRQGITSAQLDEASRREGPCEGLLRGVGSAAPRDLCAEDFKYTKAAFNAMDGPVVLVGHSPRRTQ